MRKHHIDRLEKLYAFLGTVKPEKFNLCEWAVAGDNNKADVNACGTTACAMGWAGSMPEFRKRGLKLIWDKDENTGYVELVKQNGRKRYGEGAGAEFFGLTDDEATHLFIPWTKYEENMTLSQYRRRLRKFIDRKKRELKIK